MTAFGDYKEHDATGLAELVRDKEVAPTELVEAAIEQIESFNPQLNGVVATRYDRALSEADQSVNLDAAFPGVPFLLKDLWAPLAGEPMACGSRSMRNHIASADSELVARYLRAGLIVLGKTNTPEFGLAPVTESELSGPCHNPWDPERTSGGSSGGSAVAVAACGVPMAHASDGGGSIRIPASANGLFGIKPTRGRNPQGPDMAESWFGLSEPHAITRSVRDSARLLDATRGADLGATHTAPTPERPFAEEVRKNPGRLRIAFTTGALLSTHEMDMRCVAAVEDAARLCEELGHEVTEATPAIDVEALTDAFVTLAISGGALDVEMAARLTDSKPKADNFELVTWIMYLAGKKTSAVALGKALETAKQSHRTVAGFMEDYDVLLTSTLGEPPWPIGDLDPTEAETRQLKVVKAAPASLLIDRLVNALAGELLRPIPNTPLFNMTGQPAMSVPLSWTPEGLPIGIQFVGRFADEATLFRLAAQLEAARPWWERRPPMFA
jgi:amidase